jgi:hypothetical protein
VVKVSLAELRKGLLDRMALAMPRYGFKEKPTGQSFHRSLPFGRWSFHVAFINHETDLDVTADVAVRVDAVEEMVHSGSKLLSDREKQQTATIGAELGNIADHRQKRWKIASQGDVENVAAAILEEFEKFGLPYLERYSDLEKMLDALSQNDPAAWLHSPVHSERCKRAVASALVLGKTDRASELRRRCEEFLEQRGDPGLQSFKEFASRLLGTR